MISSYQPHWAQLQWHDDGMPYSTDYGDVYYSRADALGESSHVFLRGNQLEQRFAALSDEAFTIGELGFGAGLNFLNTCRLWCATAPVDAHLHYIACELHPFKLEDLQRLFVQFPELDLFSSAFLQFYPDHSIGVHQLQLNVGAHCISLTLLYGEANEMLKDHHTKHPFKVDAWFLDGFAPKTNPEMWQETLLKQLASLSHPTTTLSSYSVAGAFRQQLSAAGFAWEKCEGFAGKRHMLQARLVEQDTRVSNTDSEANKVICVIGAGLAGCSTAYALASSGWQVILIEANSHIAAQASGNAQGILHFKPATVDAPENQFNMHSFLYASRYYQSLQLPESIWSPCGMIQLAHDHKLVKRRDKLAASDLYSPRVVEMLDQQALSERCDLALSEPGFYFPAAGWLSPTALCEHYCSHPNIKLLLTEEVSLLDQDKSGWEIMMRSEHGEHFLHAANVVLCTSADIHRFVQTRHIPVITNRGQVDSYQASPESSVKMVLCGQGYIIPPLDGLQTIGGSFFIEDDSEESKQKYSELHLQQLARIHPDLAAAFSKQEPKRRSANRCTTADRMPVVGAIDPINKKGLWANVAHGSNGLARTPISAALLASYLNETPPPLGGRLRKAISPERFLD